MIFLNKTKIALFITITLWASAFVGIREGLQGYSPGGMALLRFSVASICLLMIYFFLPVRNKISFSDKFLMMLMGGFGVGCYNLTLNYGEVSIPSGVASFIISQSPIITAIFAIIFLSEAFNLYLFLGMAVSIFGVGLITLDSLQQFDLRIGLLYVVIATLIGSVYTVLQKPFLKKYHAIEITLYAMLGATTCLLIYIPNAIHDIKTASLNATLAVIYLGIFPAAIAYAAWGYVLNDISASKASSFLYFMPVIATLLGWFFLGEVPASLTLLGGIIALLGVWIVNQFSRSKNTSHRT